MKVSVLIPFYNQEQYVDQTLGSVLSQQTDFDFEVLVGDDGSTDGTWNRIQEWRNRYPEKIRCFLQDRNKATQCFSRINQHKAFLYRLSRGEYFIFLDGDDFYFDPHKLQKQVNILDAPGNRDCSMCGHNINLYYENVNKTIPQYHPTFKTRKFNYRQYIPLLYFHSSSLMYRNTFCSTFPDALLELYFDDTFITLYWLSLGKVFYSSDIMTTWRRCDSSTLNNMQSFDRLIHPIINYDVCCRLTPGFKKYLSRQLFCDSETCRLRFSLTKEQREEILALARLRSSSTLEELIKYPQSTFFCKFKTNVKLNYYYFTGNLFRLLLKIQRRFFWN